MKTGFLESAPENASSTRLVFVAGCAWALAMGTVLIFGGSAPMEVAGFVAAIVGTFGGIKITSGTLTEKKQKKGEQ